MSKAHVPAAGSVSTWPFKLFLRCFASLSINIANTNRTIRMNSYS